jgi:hypothetical protein
MGFLQSNVVSAIWLGSSLGLWLCLPLAIIERLLVGRLDRMEREVRSRVGMWVLLAVISAGVLCVVSGGPEDGMMLWLAMWCTWGVIMIIRAWTFGEWLLGWIALLVTSGIMGGTVVAMAGDHVLSCWARIGVSQKQLSWALLSIAILSIGILLHTGIQRWQMRLPTN